MQHWLLYSKILVVNGGMWCSVVNHQFLGKIVEGGPLYALLMLFQMG